MLGLAFSKELGEVYGVSCISDINCWTDGEEPSKVLRGHQNAVTCVTNFNETLVVSGDNDGRILAWDTETGLASRPSGIYKHKIVIQALCSNSENIYSGSGDMHMGHFKFSNGQFESVALVKKASSIGSMIATNSVVYVLYNDKTLEMAQVRLDELRGE